MYNICMNLLQLLNNRITYASARMIQISNLQLGLMESFKIFIYCSIDISKILVSFEIKHKIEL